MSEWAPKRFWKTAEVAEAEGGFGVTLDGRTVKTPAKASLVVPTSALAQAIAAEWDAQIEQIDPASMPYTRGANAAIDKVRIQHGEVADMLADYGDSDLLCYRADSPAELAARQAAGWDPMLDWAEARLGARLETRIGIMHAPQTPQAVTTLRQQVHNLDAFELAAFHDLVSLTGSLVLGFAAAFEQATAPEIWALSRIDEDWQQELWGADEEAQEVADRKQAAFLQAQRFFLISQNRPN
ncbi:ATP12 family chaperone protein [Puniceibacterium sediminis]|uniref:Chaperone required for the assembly of the F1-ATPase n=1 Tax=Puniceibacterium sediminis TaxID=1608407 RepID=A0A238X600_9RHOB|nr:ATP12 family protein [Puniceibacterium sediminis]SNR53983.1 Chaperone required for the assembly of the F1-ATPase [Puniceibacterium sediminis]